MSSGCVIQGFIAKLKNFEPAGKALPEVPIWISREITAKFHLRIEKRIRTATTVNFHRFRHHPLSSKRKAGFLVTDGPFSQISRHHLCHQEQCPSRLKPAPDPPASSVKGFRFAPMNATHRRP